MPDAILALNAGSSSIKFRLFEVGGPSSLSLLSKGGMCARLHWLGVELDAAANTGGAARISAPAIRVEVRVIPTDEEVTIARHTHDSIA